MDFDFKQLGVFFLGFAAVLILLYSASEFNAVGVTSQAADSTATLVDTTLVDSLSVELDTLK